MIINKIFFNLKNFVIINIGGSVKKYLLFIILYFSLLITVEAKETVTLNKCVDGDTAWFNLNDETIKTRFLAIDTPEYTSEIEPYGKEASEFTCNMLTRAKKIEIEYDENSDKKDKYDRHLVWVFVDDELLQDLIIKEGLAEIDYLYGDYKYTNILKNSEVLAKTNKVGMWSESNYDLYLIGLTILIIIIMVVCIINKRFRNKIIKTTLNNIIKKM